MKANQRAAKGKDFAARSPARSRIYDVPLKISDLSQNPSLNPQTTLGNKRLRHLLSSRRIQAKLHVGQSGDAEEIEADRIAASVVAGSQSSPPNAKPKDHRSVQRRVPIAEPASAHVPDDFAQTLGPGHPLDLSLRRSMESQFGKDLSSVRVHTDPRSSESAHALNARAYTIGRDIVFGEHEYAPKSDAGRKLLAHELTHVVQQRGTRARVQRYEAGEHAQFGDTQAELQKALGSSTYVVQKGETLGAIARKFGITVEELKAANKERLKKWPATKDPSHMVEGFDVGEKIAIPKSLNDLAKMALKDPAAKFLVNGVVLEYGQVIAMGDLFESQEQMAKAPPAELKEIAALIDREKKSGKLVTTVEWEKATRGRYLKLAQKNVEHFAPPSANRVKPSAAGASSPNHKTEWEKHHQKALEASKSGDKDKALMINAFGDHFLTDAFSAGHLINKTDVMETFKSQLKITGKGKDREFTDDSKKFFNSVANISFSGNVQTEFSKYESTERTWGFHKDIDAAWVFSRLLQGIHMEMPDLLANAVAKGLHDQLNTLRGGLPVENAMGDKWQLSGDATLNAKTTVIAKKAVAQSQLNIISAYSVKEQLGLPSFYKKVWDFTPKPSVTGLKQLADEVKKGTEVDSADLQKSVVKLIQDNYKLIINELVRLGKLRKA